MDLITRTTFAQRDAAEGARALNRVFEQYLLPMSFTAEQLRLHVTCNDIDEAFSPLWYDRSGEVIGAAMLGVRGTRGWIGGFGIAPAYRGKKYAALLLEQIVAAARARGLTELALEVLSENAVARKVYAAAGFAVTRKLVSLQTGVEATRDLSGFTPADPAYFIDRSDGTAPCWQREPASLRHGAVSSAVAHADGTYAVYRANENAAQIFNLHAQTPERLTALAHAVAQGRPLQSLFILNEPEDSLAVRSAQEAGWKQPFLQYEMKLVL